MKKHNINIGDKFNKWTIVETKVKKGDLVGTYNRCACECGNERLIRTGEVIKSFGCITCFRKHRNEIQKNFIKYIPSTMLSMIKNNAKKRNIKFDLVLGYLDNLIEEQNFKCALSGVDLKIPDKDNYYGNKNKKHRNIITHNRKGFNISLDRINSSKGYVVGNVQWVHKTVNIMKGTLDDEQFIDICTSIAGYRNKVILKAV